MPLERRHGDENIWDMHLQRKNQKNQKKLKRKNLKKKNGKPFFINFSSFFLNFSECFLHWGRQYFSEATENPSLQSLGSWL
jgi:hypothetical protein